MSFLAQNSQLSSVYICDPIDRPLSNVAVAIWDFCDKIAETLPSGDRIAALVSSELDRFEFMAHSRELSKLINLRRDCSVKCGDGNGRIMCSAYYSAVDLLVNMRSIIDITGEQCLLFGIVVVAGLLLLVMAFILLLSQPHRELICCCLFVCCCC